MTIIKQCFWCFKKYQKKPKSNNQYFCNHNCKEAHWRARNAEKLRKYQILYRKNNLAKVRASKRKWNDKNKDYRHLWYIANANIVKTAQLTGHRNQMRSRHQAKKIVKKLGWIRKCVECGQTDKINLHHIDGNPLNNDINNLVYLCRKHHMEAHVRMNKK